MNHGGVLDYPVLPPAALPCHVPPPANLRGGTGVFLPRIEAYRYAAAPPATAKGNASTRIPFANPCFPSLCAAWEGRTDGRMPPVDVFGSCKCSIILGDLRCCAAPRFCVRS